MNDMRKLCNSINNCLTKKDPSFRELQMGEIVYLLRVKSQLTQEELAMKANVCTQTIKRLEGCKERVSDVTSRGIFEALGVHITRLTMLLDE